MPAHTPRVSVIVPVYNGWPYIEATIGSILDQTIPDLEAIFVDDGSTDETGDRLDRLAEERPDLVRVLHLPGSGAPGRPRNLGLATARGTYVQFLDADDVLAPVALERAVAMAERADAQIVIEKFASATIRRNQRLFRKNVKHCTLAERPDIVDSSLGPAKLFRKDFLQRNGIAFPEGWRLMEDQYFSLLAYLRANAIAILADTPCYFFRHREDGRHLTAEPVDPTEHFEHLGRIVDLVDAESPPGSLRDHILRRLIRVEVLARIREDTYPDVPDEYRAALFGAANAFVIARGFDGPPVTGLGPLDRRRYASLLAGDRETLVTIDRMIGSVEARAVLEGARWLSGALELRGRVDLVDRVDGRRLELRHRTDRWLLVMQRASNEPRLEIDVTDEIDRLGVSATARSRETALEWQISGRGGRRSLRHHGDADETPPAVVPIGDRFTVEIDPMAVQGVRARLDPGDWDIFLRLSWPGISVIGPLTEAEAPGPAPGPVLVGDPGQLVVPVLDDGLRMVVGAPATILAAANRGHPLRTLRTGRQLSILLTAVTSYRATPMTVAIVVRAGADDRPLVGTLRPWLGVAVLDVESSAALADLDPGPHPLVLRSGSEGALTEATLCEVTVDLLGGLGLAGARPVRFGELWLLRYRFVVSRSHGAERSAMKRVRRVLRPLVRRLRGR